MVSQMLLHQWIDPPQGVDAAVMQRSDAT